MTKTNTFQITNPHTTSRRNVFQIRNEQMWVTAEARIQEELNGSETVAINVSASGGMSIEAAQAFVAMVNQAIEAARKLSEGQ